MTKVDETNLRMRMRAPDFISGSKGLVDLHNGSIHGDLLDDLTSDLDIILGQQQEHLFGEKLLKGDEHHIDGRGDTSEPRKNRARQENGGCGQGGCSSTAPCR